ncbi:hydrogenase maturation nickel metallochaperone HypA [bacterium]|nr:hydrogenase maturation nickel metallochaperone HypA [bacterium]
MTIAMNIIDIVCQKANDENAHKINSVELEIGELSGIMIDSLEFCFEAACKNTIADGAELNIHKIKAEAFCKSCNNNFNMKSNFSPCPTCNNFDFEILKGKELSIKSFNID